MTFVESSQAQSMSLGKKVLYSFVGGSVFTLMTVLLQNTASIGALAYGYPFPWLSQSIFPLGGPMILLWTGLILDILVWTVVLFLVIKLYHGLGKGKSVTVFDTAQV